MWDNVLNRTLGTRDRYNICMVQLNQQLNTHATPINLNQTQK